MNRLQGFDLTEYKIGRYISKSLPRICTIDENRSFCASPLSAAIPIQRQSSSFKLCRIALYLQFHSCSYQSGANVYPSPPHQAAAVHEHKLA